MVDPASLILRAFSLAVWSVESRRCLFENLEPTGANFSVSRADRSYWCTCKLTAVPIDIPIACIIINVLNHSDFQSACFHTQTVLRLDGAIRRRMPSGLHVAAVGSARRKVAAGHGRSRSKINTPGTWPLTLAHDDLMRMHIGEVETCETGHGVGGESD